MAISTANVSYLTAGPAQNNQVMQASELTKVELAYIGTVSAVLDGSATTGNFNYIDGTNQLPFTPKGFIYARCSNNNSGGNAAAANTVVIQDIVDNNNNNLGATFTVSAAGSNNQGLTFSVIILK